MRDQNHYRRHADRDDVAGCPPAVWNANRRGSLGTVEEGVVLTGRVTFAEDESIVFRALDAFSLQRRLALCGARADRSDEGLIFAHHDTFPCFALV
jgi:hypothetical protein